MSLRQLRDTRRLKAWLREGKTVELRERNQLLGRVVPERGGRPTAAAWPHFEERAKRIFGKRRLPGASLAIEERGRY